MDVVDGCAFTVEHAGNVEGADGEGVQFDIEPHGRHLAHALRHFFRLHAVVKVQVPGFYGAGVRSGQMPHLIAGKGQSIPVIQAVHGHTVGAVVEGKDGLREVQVDLAYGYVEVLCRYPGRIRLAAKADPALFYPELREGNLLEEGLLGLGRVRFLRLRRFQEQADIRLPEEQAVCPGLAFEEAEPVHVLELNGFDVSFQVRSGIRGVPNGKVHMLQFQVSGQQGKVDLADLDIGPGDLGYGRPKLMLSHCVDDASAQDKPRQDGSRPNEGCFFTFVKSLHTRSF